MKTRLFLCAVLLGLLTVPAFADSLSISFTNMGLISGNLSSTVRSGAHDLTFDGVVIEPGQFATLDVVLGKLTGSLKNGGSFSGGNFELENGGAVLFQSSFSGTWSTLGGGLYDLAGTFSTVFDGVRYAGRTDQLFSVFFHDNHLCLKDLRGQTSLTATVVPEPNTLVLMGTGLVSIAAVLRRKLGTALSSAQVR